MPPLPTLGPQPEKNTGKVAAIAILVGLLAGGGFYYVKLRKTSAEAVEAANVAARAAEEKAQAVAAAAQLPPSPPTPSEERQKAGVKLASVEIHGPLETALVDAVGPGVGPALAQVVTRSLVWWVEVPNELLRGDKLEVLFQERPSEEPLVLAVRFQSGKTGKLHSAYRFQQEGEAFARYYEADGAELERRLVDSPIEDYEQVTSLIRDGRRHKGVDFKAPVGTPVKATFSGTITRKNWNFRGNGNSLELAAGGKKALYLHLSELPSSIKVGQRVQKGEVIAQSGNTGRSFAPHLHFQLMGPSDKVLDPFEGPTTRRSLGGAPLAKFKVEKDRFDGLLGSATTSSAAAGP